MHIRPLFCALLLLGAFANAGAATFEPRRPDGNVPLGEPADDPERAARPSAPPTARAPLPPKPAASSSGGSDGGGGVKLPPRMVAAHSGARQIEAVVFEGEKVRSAVGEVDLAWAVAAAGCPRSVRGQRSAPALAADGTESSSFTYGCALPPMLRFSLERAAQFGASVVDTSEAGERAMFLEFGRLAAADRTLFIELALRLTCKGRLVSIAVLWPRESAPPAANLTITCGG